MSDMQYPFKNDHEVVITLIEDFTNQVSEFNRQQISNSTELLEIKKILMQQNQQLDKRLVAIEEELKDIDVKKLAKTVEDNTVWINNFNRTKHTAWVVLATSFGIMGYLLNFLVNYLSHIH